MLNLINAVAAQQKSKMFMDKKKKEKGNERKANPGKTKRLFSFLFFLLTKTVTTENEFFEFHLLSPALKRFNEEIFTIFEVFFALTLKLCCGSG